MIHERWPKVVQRSGDRGANLLSLTQGVWRLQVDLGLIRIFHALPEGFYWPAWNTVEAQVRAMPRKGVRW
jgi:hypothetical protein